MKFEQKIRQIMEGNWNAKGYTAPNFTNSKTYPYLWLWDSCFHCLVWAELAEDKEGVEVKDRALVELENILEAQDELGFLPHVNYCAKPNPKFGKWARRWGRTHSSSITQPPMFGHTIAEFHRKGIDISEQIIEQAGLGLNFFVKHRKRDLKNGLLYLCHPWESGMDNSPRWDDYGGKSSSGDNFDVKTWNKKKWNFLKTIEFSPSGAPLFNPAFPVTSIGFNALVAFNILELCEVTGDTKLKAAAQEITQALQTKFSPELATWTDGEVDGDEVTGSGSVRTLDALLVGLVLDKNNAAENAQLQIIWDQLNNKTSDGKYEAFGGEYGPPSVHRSEPSFSPDVYWRGSVWPQMNYLFWILCRRKADEQITQDLETAFIKGVTTANFSEYWDADTGQGLGANPQSWSCLALLIKGG